MFQKSAQWYDTIYSLKDYAAEAELVRDLIIRYSPSGGTTMLDVGCGTGMHAKHLADPFAITGLDLDAGLLAVARQRLPDAVFVQGDMRDFDLGKTFDAVICLFSSIGYVGSVEALDATLANLARHAKTGGVVLVEPWFYPETLIGGYVGTRHVNEGSRLQIVRMNHTTLDGRVSTLHFHYLIGTPDGIEYFTEDHRLTCFTHEEYVAAFEAAGLRVTLETPGLDGRGLYVGVK